MCSDLFVHTWKICIIAVSPTTASPAFGLYPTSPKRDTTIARRPHARRCRFSEGEALFCPADAVFTCTQVVTITQDDMDAGSFSGNVTVTAVTPEGKNITVSAPSSTSLDGASSVNLGGSLVQLSGAHLGEECSGIWHSCAIDMVLV